VVYSAAEVVTVMVAYPKGFFATAQVAMEPGLCFVLMPFDPTFDPVWEILQEVVESEPFSLRCLRADEISRPGYIMEDVLEYIARANIILADLTGRNPNVFYELGIAHTAKPSSRVFLLSQSIEYIPFDLRHLRFLIYKTDLSDLRARLADALSQSGLRQYRIFLHEQERKKFPGRISGRDRCLYEVELEGHFLGDDGVKFTVRVVRFVAGEQPGLSFQDGCYLGIQRNTFELPELDWKLRFEGGDRNEARILLQRD
jgi:hypothetical protein